MTEIRDNTELVNYIKSIDWKQFKTAYNNEYSDYWTGYGHKIPKMQTLLIQLFSDNIKLAAKSAALIGSSVCHQNVYISTAALPVCDVILYGLKTLDIAVKGELILIIYGLISLIPQNQPEQTWQWEIRKKIEAEKELFCELTKSDNKEVADYAKIILEVL